MGVGEGFRDGGGWGREVDRGLRKSCVVCRHVASRLFVYQRPKWGENDKEADPSRRRFNACGLLKRLLVEAGLDVLGLRREDPKNRYGRA